MHQEGFEPSILSAGHFKCPVYTSSTIDAKFGARSEIRTHEGIPGGFAIRCLWPLSNPSKLVEAEGFEPVDLWIRSPLLYPAELYPECVQTGLEPVSMFLRRFTTIVSV